MAAGAAVCALLSLVIGYVLVKGARILGSIGFSLDFITTDMGLTGPLAPLSQGGVLHALVGTLEQITIALIITVPLGIATALFLNEVRRAIRPAGTHGRRGDDRSAVRRRRTLHLRVDHLAGHPAVQRLRGVPRDHGAHASDHDPGSRRGPQARAGQPSRSRSRAGCRPVERRTSGRAPHGPVGPDDRDDPGDGAWHRRDGTGAAHRRCHQQPQHEPVQRTADLLAACRAGVREEPAAGHEDTRVRHRSAAPCPRARPVRPRPARRRPAGG